MSLGIFARKGSNNSTTVDVEECNHVWKDIKAEALRVRMYSYYDHKNDYARTERRHFFGIHQVCIRCGKHGIDEVQVESQYQTMFDELMNDDTPPR